MPKGRSKTARISKAIRRKNKGMPKKQADRIAAGHRRKMHMKKGKTKKQASKIMARKAAKSRRSGRGKKKKK